MSSTNPLDDEEDVIVRVVGGAVQLTRMQVIDGVIRRTGCEEEYKAMENCLSFDTNRDFRACAQVRYWVKLITTDANSYAAGNEAVSRLFECKAERQAMNHWHKPQTTWNIRTYPYHPSICSKQRSKFIVFNVILTQNFEHRTTHSRSRACNLSTKSEETTLLLVLQIQTSHHIHWENMKSRLRCSWKGRQSSCQPSWRTSPDHVWAMQED